VDLVRRLTDDEGEKIKCRAGINSRRGQISSSAYLVPHSAATGGGGTPRTFPKEIHRVGAQAAERPCKIAPGAFLKNVRDRPGPMFWGSGIRPAV
jgi:hypothetical protein